MGFSLIMGLLGIFNRKLNRQADWIKKLSDCTYAVFIIHTPVLVTLSLGVRNLHLDPFFKAMMLAPIALALSFSAALILKKIPVLNKII